MSSQVDAWVHGYLQAWTSNDPEDVRRLFTEDARYRKLPRRDPWVGHRAIVEAWLELADVPGTWTFDHEVLAVSGDLAFVQGRTSYEGGETYESLWVIRLASDGRCSEFTEW
jgi:ketosteroid isomerase-like protein